MKKPFRNLSVRARRGLCKVPPPAVLVRRQPTGSPLGHEEVAAKYAPAKINGHDVTPCVFEVFGSAAPEVLQLLEGWGRAARSKTPPGEEPPWSARNFIPTCQILNRADGEAADREAARLRSAGS